MSTKNLARTMVEGGHYASANMKFRLHRRRERALAKAYCRDPERADEKTIPEARRMKNLLWWDDIHNHHWWGRLNNFFAAHIDQPVDNVLQKLVRRHRSNSYQDRMILMEAKWEIKSTTKYGNLRFMIDENGIIRHRDPNWWYA